MIADANNESSTPKTKTVKVLREKAFANRLEKACEGNPNCPTDQHRGKQKWIYEMLGEKFGIKVSPEGVRKWFAGESRPRPKIMSALAQVLEVDEAWLSLGVAPDLTPVERKKRNAMATGAVNYLAGVIQLGGGHIAFPDDESPQLFAIINGKRVEVEAVLPFDLGGGKLRLTIADTSLEDKVVVAVVPQGDFHFALMVIPSDLIWSSGERRGNFYEVILEHRVFKWFVGDEQVHVLTSIKELIGAQVGIS